MPTSIKITDLGEIANANIIANVLLPVVQTDGTDTTYKANLGNVANAIMVGSGTIFQRAANANVAFTVADAAQPAITSVGTLTSLTITGNANITNGTINNGTSNVIITSSGNISLSAAGTANVLIIATTGANIAGTANVSGTVFGNNVVATLMVKTTPTVLGSLPAAATAGAGARAFITDANLTMVAANIGSIVGSGAPNADIPIWSDGIDWRVG